MAFTVLTILVVILLCFRKAGVTAWSVALIAYLMTISQILHLSGAALIVAAAPAALTLLLLNISALRRWLITKPAYNALRSALPEISATEQAAIDAGTVSWDGELLQPRPNWKQLLEYPKPTLTESEQAFIDGPLAELCNMLDDWRINHLRDDLPREVWRFMKRERFFGMIIDPAYGGLGFSAFAHSTVVMTLSTRSISAAVTVMVPNSLGPAELLHLYGTNEQRRHYLPRLAKGTDIPCFALTSTVAGSDAGAIIDSGVVCRGKWNGEEVLGFRLNWNKRYITLSPIATLIGLAFKAYDPDHLLGEREELGITCALVPASTPGITQGARHRPMNTVFMNGPIQGKDVFIPFSQIIGGEARIGQGWSMLMNCLSVGRSVSLPALSTGAGKLACLTTGAYARIREQFNNPIANFEGVSEALAPIAGLTYLMDSARQLTVGLVDQGEKPSVPSAILKYHNTEAMRRVVNHAMDIHGGRAIIEGPRNYLARIYQAIPISITVEGANILTRSMMIFGQGAIRCHPFLLREMNATHMERRAAIRELDRLLGQHLQRNLEAAARSLLLGISNGRFGSASHPDDDVRRALNAMEQQAASFVVVSDLSLALLGGNLKVRESISGRLGDCLSHLYLGSALIKRFTDDGCPAADRELLRWGINFCLYQTQQALAETLDNFPARWLGAVVKRWVFPLGRRHQHIDDSLNATVANLLTRNGEARQHLVQGVHCPADPNDPVGRIESAFVAKLACSGLVTQMQQWQHQGHLSRGRIDENKIDEALTNQLLNSADATQLKQMLAKVDDAVQVDDYLPAKAKKS